jgi:hypothetical protein
MTRTRGRSMETAPRTGTVVLVRHGPEQLWAEAFWSPSMQHWVNREIADLRVLHNVTAWRPLI